MLDVLRAGVRFVDRRIGWNRIGFAISLVIIAIAAAVLFHILRDLDFAALLTALGGFKSSNVLIACASVAAAYFTLSFYDLFALRTIGRPEVPYRVAIFAAFTSYSVGHNVGASVFTGGAVRYRIYSAWGLSAVEVAKLCFVAGLTFWLGNATVLGLGIFYVPHAASAIDQLPPLLNRILAIGLLVALVTYVSWVWRKPRVIGRSNWEVRLPNGPLTLVQIVIGIADLSFCALAMYVLMPADPHIGFVELALIFVAATLLGFASYAPGGLGVFDAAMMVALVQFDKEQLLAGLLIFRLLYYIVPFALALLMLGARELWLNMTGAAVPAANAEPRHDENAAAAPGKKRETV